VATPPTPHWLVRASRPPHEMKDFPDLGISLPPQMESHIHSNPNQSLTTTPPTPHWLVRASRPLDEVKDLPDLGISLTLQMDSHIHSNPNQSLTTTTPPTPHRRFVPLGPWIKSRFSDARGRAVKPWRGVGEIRANSRV